MPFGNLLLVGNLGCLVLFLMFFNLIFGKFIFGSVLAWLGVELFLFLILISLNKLITYRFFRRHKAARVSRPDDVIDVPGQAVEDKE